MRASCKDTRQLSAYCISVRTFVAVCRQLPGGLQRVDERVVDHLDLWVVNDFGVRLIHLFDATLYRECLGSGSVARGHSDHSVAEQLSRLDDSVIGDPSRGEDADLERANLRDSSH